MKITRVLQHGQVKMVQMKKSKDANVGYAFIRFEDKEVERMMVKEKHIIEGKQVSLKHAVSVSLPSVQGSLKWFKY